MKQPIFNTKTLEDALMCSIFGLLLVALPLCAIGLIWTLDVFYLKAAATAFILLVVACFALNMLSD